MNICIDFISVDIFEEDNLSYVIQEITAPKKSNNSMKCKDYKRKVEKKKTLKKSNTWWS